MDRNIEGIEYEIVNQILIAEICFDICKSIPIILGRASDFLPFYYNFNFSKGVIVLHGLLLSKERDELSIRNYLKRYKAKFPNKSIDNFEGKIKLIREGFKKVFPVFPMLRHKICAHIDKKFKHSDFASGYTLPESIERYISITHHLKKAYFELCNWDKDIYPLKKIIEQTQTILKLIK